MTHEHPAPAPAAAALAAAQANAAAREERDARLWAACRRALAGGAPRKARQLAADPALEALGADRHEINRCLYPRSRRGRVSRDPVTGAYRLLTGRGQEDDLE